MANTAYVARALGFARGFAEFFDWGLNVATEVRDAVAQWLKKRRGRIFLFMNILDPHEPYSPPPPFDQLFPGRAEQYGTAMTVLVNGGATITPDMHAHFTSQYDGEVAFADQALVAEPSVEALDVRAFHGSGVRRRRDRELDTGSPARARS